ncbi:MAG: 1-phosphofructokinase family hexose kinase [Limnochordaceae bacterium]|nr:1-phosphofructokinase family hexose kinase [Limnochordaceae bacterium]
MIVTVTLNPSLDRTLRFVRVERGQLNRAEEVREDASGKGINVSLALRQLGQESLVVALVAGRIGQRVVDGLSQHGLECRFVWLEAGETRVSTKVYEQEFGMLTELNEPGPPVTPDDLEAVRRVILQAVSPGDVVIFSGSIPPGCPPNYYAAVGRNLRERGVSVVIDTSGQALRESLTLPPQIAKPNRDELSQLVGVPLPDSETAAEAGRAVWEKLSSGRPGDSEALILTLGAEGAVFFTAQGMFRAIAPVETGGTTAGCGDALLAATVHGLQSGWSWETIARFATATAAATAAIVGTRFPARAEVERRLSGVEVRRLPERRSY